jgi:hypothetical protein
VVASIDRPTPLGARQQGSCRSRQRQDGSSTCTLTSDKRRLTLMLAQVRDRTDSEAIRKAPEGRQDDDRAWVQIACTQQVIGRKATGRWKRTPRSDETSEPARRSTSQVVWGAGGCDAGFGAIPLPGEDLRPESNWH